MTFVLLETDNPPDDGPLCESNVVSDKVEAAIRQLPLSTVPVEQSAVASQGTHDVLYSVHGTPEIYVRLVIALGFQQTNLQDTCTVASRNSCASWAIS